MTGATSHVNPRHLADYALRTNSPARADLLLGHLSNPRVAPAAGALASRIDSLLEVVPSMRGDDLRWLIQFARVVALGSGTDDQDHARAMFTTIAEHHGISQFETTELDLFVQLLVTAGIRPDEHLLRSVSSPIRWALEVDLENPMHTASRDLTGWLETFNQAFQSGDLESIGISTEASAENLFDRLTCSSPPGAIGGQLVSVIMPAYAPDHGIVLAVRSLLEQSWADLEIIIVDDGSPESTKDHFEHAAALDTRVTVVSAERNGGTYHARNIGLARARGTFLTFHDSDDWAHPRKIERQVQSLLENPELVANRSWALRAHPTLELTYPGYPPQRINASSLMFRRQILNDVAGFDDARKSADMEFTARLRATYPQRVRDLPESQLLSIVQLRSGSLSRADARPGWTHWSRIAYRDAYQEWHGRVRHGIASPTPYLAHKRQFPLPTAAWTPQRTTPRGVHYDVLYVGDWRKGRGRQQTLLNELWTLSGAGLAVGIASAESPIPLASKREPIHPEVQRMISAGYVDLTHLSEPVNADLVVSTHPAALKHVPDITRISAKRVILASHDNADLNSQEITGHASRIFGVSATWAVRRPLSKQILEVESESSREAVTLPATYGWPMFRHGISTTPIVGHHLPDEPKRTPSDPRTVFEDLPTMDVRFLAGTTSMMKRARMTPTWLTYRTVPMGRFDFLRQLDFFVYAGEPDEVARIAANEAISAGCVAIIGTESSDAAPDAAIICDENEIAATVRDLSSDPSMLDQKRRFGFLRSREIAAEFCSALGVEPDQSPCEHLGEYI